MKIFFINNDGGGFADHLEIEGGTTVEQLFERRESHLNLAIMSFMPGIVST